MNQYAELLCRSNFSFLRGASDSREYIERAQKIGISAVGITDINGVYALPRAFEVLKQNPDVKLISGAQITIENHPPISFLAQTRQGYGLLCRLITQAHADKEKGQAALKFSELISLMESHPGSKHLIAIPVLTADTNFALLKSIFENQIYISLTRYLDGLDSDRTKSAFEVSRKFEIPLFASNDVHYHDPQRRYLQDCLTCIREKTSLRKAGFKLFGNNERYLKSPLQMGALFKDAPQLITNTMKIAETCTFRLSELKYTYPQEFIPKGHTSQSYLEQCVFEKARDLYKGHIPQAVDNQIRHELKLVAKLNYPDYFLTVYDIVRFAASRNIICQGRGSAANSTICYVLGITSVDPIKFNLLFERFMSEERAEPPDIDVDFEHERREEIIQYIYQRYGRDRAAMVSAVRTYQRRSAFIELSKAVGIETGTISADVLDRDFSNIAKTDQNKRETIDRLADQLKGFPRHISIHSGGFVLSQVPLTEIVPVEPARMEDRTIVQWDKNDLETLGLMKVDILALGFLTALHKVADLAGRQWRDVPSDDPETYQMIREAKTEGTFQIESRAQKAMLVRSLPQTFYDLVVQVALVRPGPNVGNMVRPYLQRRQDARNGKFYQLPSKDMEPTLGRTYGVPIFQEQIMKLAITKGGFEPGEADQLRRALAAWRSASSVAAMGQKLYDGLIKNGVPKSYADELFSYVKGYAHYGFPESHAASFASIAYKSAFYKRHYPAEFLCGLINSQPMGFYPIDTLINEAKRAGVVVLPIDPHISQWDTTLTPQKEVRMGFRNIKGIQRESVDHMISVRQSRPFISIEDFIARTQFSKGILKNLIMADVFYCFGKDQRHSFWDSLEFQNLVTKNSKLKKSKTQDPDQLNLFKSRYQNHPHLYLVPRYESTHPRIFEEMSLLEEIVSDYKTLGYSLRGNVMKGLRLENLDLPKTSSLSLREMKKGQLIQLAGVLSIIQRPPTAKGVAFITLEDEFGSMDFIAKKNVFEQFKHVIRSSRFLIIHGKVQVTGAARTVIVNKIESFMDQKIRQPTGANRPRFFR